MTRPDPFQQSARELAIEAGLDPDARAALTVIAKTTYPRLRK